MNRLFTFAICLLAATVAAASVPPHEADLIQILNSDADEKAKDDACRALAEAGSKVAVPALARLLADEKFNLVARDALEAIPGPESEAALRNALASLKGRPLAGVAASLGVRRDQKAVAPLARLLADADPEVVPAAALALGNIASAGAVKALQHAMPHAAAANRSVFGEALLRAADSTLAAGQKKRALSIYEQLNGMTPLPMPIRAASLRGEIAARAPNNAAVLKRGLASPADELFGVAIRAILELRPAGSSEMIAESLPRFTGNREVAAMATLGELGDDLAVSRLLPLTKLADAATRAAALRAAAATGKAAVIPVMVESLDSPEPEVVRAALDALAGMKVPEAPAAVETAVDAPSGKLRTAGIGLLARRGMTNAVPQLLKAATDPEPSVSAAALHALGELGSPAQLQPLFQSTIGATNADQLDSVREAAESICTRSGDPAASAAAMINICNQAVPPAKALFLSVLASVGGPEALQAVCGALKDPNAEVRQAALLTLAEWPDLSAAPTLLQVIGTAAGAPVRDAAFRGLITLIRDSSAGNDEKLKWTVAAAKSARTPAEKKLALAALGGIPSVESLHAVTPLLAEPEVAGDAAAAAWKIAGGLGPNSREEVIPALNQVLKVSQSEALRENVRNRLKQLGQ